MQLFRELRQRSYPGSYGPVAAYARRLRHAQDKPRHDILYPSGELSRLYAASHHRA